MSENICKFLPKFNNYNFFNIINLVYETQASSNPTAKPCATYRMNIITDGKGIYRTEKGDLELNIGDILFIPPAKPFSIINCGDLKYIYISYLGNRANLLIEEMRFDSFGNVYNGFERLIPLWRSALSLTPENANLSCEGIILFTCAEIGNIKTANTQHHRTAPAAERIKKHIDDNFNKPELNLKTISKNLSYSTKYISSVFRKEYNICITEYIRTIRIQHACTLIEHGLTSVKNIALLCGYDDPLYFSAVFKKQIGASPREHINTVKKQTS